MNSREIGKEKEGSHKSGFQRWKGLIAVVGIFLLLATIFLTQRAKVEAKSITCTAPVGYELVSNTMATNLAGQSFYIARAIVNSGDGASGGKAVSIQACVSKDPALQTVGGVFAYLRDGRMVFIASAVIGVEVPLPQPPQP